MLEGSAIVTLSNYLLAGLGGRYIGSAGRRVIKVLLFTFVLQ